MAEPLLRSLVLALSTLALYVEAQHYSMRLFHRFSGEPPAACGGGGSELACLQRGSYGYYRALLSSDLSRHRRRRLAGGTGGEMFPIAGGDVFDLGNEFGWLHYTWIDVGTPNISFLVALDVGSNLFWVPCECLQCAPLSGDRANLGKALGVYNPSLSRTSKHLSCSHELCASGSSCGSPKEPCPYTVDYYSENTSTSGFLLEDKIYLASRDHDKPIHASVIIGCGRKQSGGYLDGIAPDGLLGLGFGPISVPSTLARAGLVRNSFSICFGQDDTGKLSFGDKGVSNQQSTPFVTLDGKYITYIVDVEKFCIGTQCLGHTSLQLLVDSGSSFTYLPDNIYKRVAHQFDKQVSAPRMDYDDSTWEYCYNASALQVPEIPAVMLLFTPNVSFAAVNPIFPIFSNDGELTGFCLALQSSADTFGTMGQNFMTGYRMVFDRENLKLGWSHSNCQDIDSSKTMPITPPPSESQTENPLPTDERQNPPGGNAISPAVAVRTPTNTNSLAPSQFHVSVSLSFLLLFYTDYFS